MQKRGKAGHWATCLRLERTILWASHCTDIGIILTTWEFFFIRAQSICSRCTAAL